MQYFLFKFQRSGQFILRVSGAALPTAGAPGPHDRVHGAPALGLAVRTL